MKNFIIILLIFLSSESYSQILKGTILDKDTKKPVDYAVAYFAGTFTGANSDKDGKFELDISKNTSMPLTISALGYYSVNIPDFSADNPLMVYLTPKVFELNEVVIGAGNIKKDRREREKNLRLFRREFLGETPNGRLCKITNENDITFTNEYDTLKAFCSKPILIDNLALGYRITFFLDRFEFVESESVMYLRGNILFNSDLNSKNSQKESFERKRRNVYYGSRMQFFRALWDDELDSEGFRVIDSTNTKLLRGILISEYENQFSRKYFKYRGDLRVKYGNENREASVSKLLYLNRADEIESRLAILSDSVYFDRNGSLVEGVRWYGRMGKQRIADCLPFEYSPNQDEIENSDKRQNLLLREDSIGQLPIAVHPKLSNALPGEKVFLHLDRPNYLQGDTIWFKAYSWFGYDQLPDTVSKVLYVDLLNPKDSIELKKKLLITNGTSVGEFILDKSIPPGKYTLRAYTRWMQNENAGEPFYQVVSIGAANQNFQVDCSPIIIKQVGGDSLKVSFRFYELDQAGDLKNDFSHKVNYTVRVGDRMLNLGQPLSENSADQVFKCRLPAIGENDSVAVLHLSIKDDELTFEKQFRIPLREELDVQFFPEGGNMVNGLESKVAFKAIGPDGLSREVKGVIKDGAGEVVTSFKSLHKGMGVFMFKPELKKEYAAFVEYKHREFKFPLPKPDEEGCLMSVSNLKNDSIPIVTIKYSSSKANQRKYIAGSAYGKIWFTSPINTSEDSCRVRIPLDILPEGISRLTILNSEFNPECERLFYVDKNQRFKIEVKADSLFYGTRSKVTLQIKTKGTDSSAVRTNLSLVVVDKDHIIRESGNGGISAYKLLESELKGTIEDAGWYFKDDSCANDQALDLLLLTQGYRRFFGSKVETHGGASLKYMPERSFDVTGKLTLPGNSKRDKNFNYSDLGITLFCPNGNAYFDQTRSDSLGHFSFNVPIQFGKPVSLLRAFTSNGKLSREKIPKEKSFRGEILLNEPAPVPLFKTPVHPPAITSPSIDYIRQLQAVKRSEVSKNADSIKWKLNLPEFTITGKDKRWYERFEDEAKKIVDMDSLDPTGKKYGNLYDLLVRDFGARKTLFQRIETIHLPTLYDWWFPIYLLNGQTYFNGGEDSVKFNALLNFLYSIKVNEIKTLMILPPGNFSYYYGDPKIYIGSPPIVQSLVVIETYSQKNFYRGDPDGIKTFILEGLDAPRVFYSPRYDGASLKNPIYEGRATLYWNPSILTDLNGEARVEFYTSDRKTEMEVLFNGLELGNGNTGQGRAIINMTNKR